MDIEFIVQDVYSLTRPQWKLATSFEEASKAFQLAIAQDQKNAGVDSAADAEADPDAEDAESEASSDEEGDGDGIMPEADGEEDANSDDEEGHELDVRTISTSGTV
jgi:regulator of nonsense transcripts 2